MNLSFGAVDRRSFLRRASALGATSLVAGAGFGPAFAPHASANMPGVSSGDIDILKFLAAAELVEDDLWQQYAELAVGNPKYIAALQRIDPSLPRYIQDDRDDERSHAALINAYLVSIGQQPVNLDGFRTLPSVRVRGADQTKGRLTNLTNLTIDTSWYNRYRSSDNPDFGATFPQVVTIKNQTTVPISDTISRNELDAIAHSAAFHFATIEQGGSSLYASLVTKVTDLDVLAILTSIGPVEVYHFAAFHKSLELMLPVRTANVQFPNFRTNPGVSQAIFPEPCELFDIAFPGSSVIRPRTTEKAGALATAVGLVQSKIFEGQPQAFFDAVVALATAADNATRTSAVS